MKCGLDGEELQTTDLESRLDGLKGMKTDRKSLGADLADSFVTLECLLIVVLTKVHQPLFNSFLGFLVSNLALLPFGAAEQQQQLSKLFQK